MSRILVVGVGPMPAPHLERVYAPGLRLEGFVNALLGAGHQVSIGEISFNESAARQFSPRRDADAHRLIGPGLARATSDLEHWLRMGPPQAIVALTDIGALAAVRSAFQGPIFVDYFGHPLAERQQQATVHQSDASLADAWCTVLPVLLRADSFSACSNSQRLALIGELGAAGRLNSKTAGYEFVQIIPPALPFSEPLEPHHLNIRGKYNLPANAPLLLSSGGFNTWMDAETLFLGLEGALRQEPGIHFVCTGGAIEGHVTRIYEEFAQKIAQSDIAPRCHLLGWVPHEDLLDLMQTATVAVNCDLPVLEGELGCRNRILGWLWAGMRVVTTVTSHPAIELSASGTVRAVRVGDWKDLARALAEEALKGRHEDAAQLRQELQDHYGPQTCYAPAVAWAEDPQPAPDRPSLGAPENPLTELQHKFLGAAAASATDGHFRRTARETSQRLLGSRMISIYLKMNPEVKRALEELADL